MAIVCTIDETGIHAPQLSEILAYLVGQFQEIYGEDIYLGNDSQDGQLIGIFATAIHDCNAQTVAVYNAFSPSTAQFNGLSSVVKINGLKRLVPSNSTVDLLLGGTAGTTITDGYATDADAVIWDLPGSVTIPSEGQVTVTAICRKSGAVAALPGSITNIGTPTRGWQTVTNLSPATQGAPVEKDEDLRRRQAFSTALPSLSVFEGTVGAVASVSGVTRLRGYENDGSVADANGLPAHSISLVVEGGDADAIAQAISTKKTPGTTTYGTTSVNITDQYGVTRAIRFYRPTFVTIKVALNVTAMTGYTTAIEASIKAAIVEWVNALEIGETVEFAEIYLPANLNGDAARRTYKITGMTIAKNAGAPGTSDIPIAFNEAATAVLSDITITVA